MLDDKSQNASDRVIFNRDNKFDIQLSASLLHERKLAEILACRKIENAVRLELKSESWQWERTGNICIEYMCDRKPSGISTTEADYWVHELRRDDETLLYLLFPIDRLKALAREWARRGRIRHGAGDDRRFSVIIIPLREILK